MIQQLKQYTCQGVLFFVSFLFCSAAFATSTLHAVKHGKAYPAYPTVNYGAGAKAAQIKRGEYLVKMGDCVACHTNSKAGGKPFAGGLAFTDKRFGTVYSSNITPDPKTGIGKWTDKQFIRAMRQGIMASGKYLTPALPYVYFNKVTDADLLAIRAYLNAVPPVMQENKALGLRWPLSWRFLQIGWRTMFFTFSKTGPYKPDPKKSAKWNRGAYIVLGLGHCAQCHTPKNFLGADKNKYALTGNFIDGFYAPNITSTALSKVQVEQIEAVFLKDKLLEGGAVQGPMKEVNHYSLSHLTDNDLEAIAVYLKSVKSLAPPVPKVAKKTSPQLGMDTYKKYCAACHSFGAGGAPVFGSAKSWAPVIKQGRNLLYQHAINGFKNMPAKGMCSTCSDVALQAAVDYMVTNSQKK